LSDEVVARAAVRGGGNEALAENRAAPRHQAELVLKPEPGISESQAARKSSFRTAAAVPRNAKQKQAALSLDAADAASSTTDEAAADPPRRPDPGSALAANSSTPSPQSSAHPANSSGLSANSRVLSANSDEKGIAARRAGAVGASRRGEEHGFSELGSSGRDGRSTRDRPPAALPFDWLAMPF
jgi:hypothetical protein